MTAKVRDTWPRWLRRRPWENGATTIIALGIVMLTQPFSMTVYSYSFLTILCGSLGFVVASHFPERG